MVKINLLDRILLNLLRVLQEFLYFPAITPVIFCLLYQDSADQVLVILTLINGSNRETILTFLEGCIMHFEHPGHWFVMLVEKKALAEISHFSEADRLVIISDHENELSIDIEHLFDFFLLLNYVFIVIF